MSRPIRISLFHCNLLKPLVSLFNSHTSYYIKLLTIDEHYIESERMSSAVAMKTEPVRFKAAAPSKQTY